MISNDAKLNTKSYNSWLTEHGHHDKDDSLAMLVCDFPLNSGGQLAAQVTPQLTASYHNMLTILRPIPQILEVQRN